MSSQNKIMKSDSTKVSKAIDQAQKKNSDNNLWPCIYHFGLGGKKVGSCKQGSKCPYSHNPESKALYEKPEKPCAFHFGLDGKKPGSCRKGESCVFSHDSKCLATANNNKKMSPSGEETKASGICLWKYEDGIKKVFLIDHTMKQTGEVLKAEPGGKIEADDPFILFTAIREFKEETGAIPPFVNESNEGNIYLPNAKYLMFIHKVTSSFTFPPGTKGDFLEITEKTKLHPRSAEFLRDFTS